MPLDGAQPPAASSWRSLPHRLHHHRGRPVSVSSSPCRSSTRVPQTAEPLKRGEPLLDFVDAAGRVCQLTTDHLPVAGQLFSHDVIGSATCGFRTVLILEGFLVLPDDRPPRCSVWLPGCGHPLAGRQFELVVRHRVSFLMALSGVEPPRGDHDEETTRGLCRTCPLTLSSAGLA